MYSLSKQLKQFGFNIDLLKNVIERNKFLRKFNTLQYFCIYVSLKNIKIEVDGNEIFVKPQHALFVGPYRIVEFQENMYEDVYVIVFTSLFYEKSKKDSFFLNSEVFFNNLEKVVMRPYFGSDDYITTLLSKRLIYFSNADQELYLTVGHSIIEGLILDALMHSNTKNENKAEKLNLLTIGNNFKTLLQKDLRGHHSVSYYASKLCITPKKLTNVCKYLYGETTKKIIVRKLCNECVIALTNSNLTISEISFEFGFSCESNFTHFMKKCTGKSPSELRVFEKDYDL